MKKKKEICSLSRVERKNYGRNENFAAWNLNVFHFFFPSFSFLFPEKLNELKMAPGRRYKAKLHVLEEDDLASILTPAPPCKVPGLGTKGPFFVVDFAPASISSLPRSLFALCGSHATRRFRSRVWLFAITFCFN